MKRYHLLRNNREAGPFTFRELKDVELLPNDLVWVEGESTAWSYPTEIDELTQLCEANSSKATPKQRERVSLFDAEPTPPLREKPTPVPVMEPLPKPSFEELAKKYAEKMPQRRTRIKSSNVGAGVFGMVVLILGTMMVALVVRDLVGRFQDQPALATADAQVIDGETLVQSSASHAAFSETASPSNGLQQTSTSSSSQLPSDTLVAQPAIVMTGNTPAAPLVPAKPEKAKKEEKVAVQNPLATETQSTAAVKDEPSEPTADKEAKAANAGNEGETTAADDKKPLAAKLVISANDYKKGFLGGVSDLELTVKNSSSQSIDKATIVVDYLKPNGKLVQTQTVEVSGLDAGETKKVGVPNTSRGVNVRYRVVNR